MKGLFGNSISETVHRKQKMSYCIFLDQTTNLAILIQAKFKELEFNTKTFLIVNSS